MRQRAQAVDFISQNYGEDYLQEGAAKAKANGTKVQDAHEAIRPSDITRLPSDDQGLSYPETSSVSTS